MYGLAKPFLFCLDAETAHHRGLQALELAYRTGLNPFLAMRPKDLPTQAFGIRFRNPVGCAAGLDKNGEHIDALLALGFGFVEVGTVTPRPQEGNPKPRMFRLPEKQAVINRLGFNNLGVDALVRNVEKAKREGVLGINIGKNKDTPNEKASEDYVHCLEKVFALADYVTVNISSPNTQGLRELQSAEYFRRFVGDLREAQEELSGIHGHKTPMLIKIAPDLEDTEMDAIAEVLNSAKVDGVIATNTTVDRLGIEGHALAAEAGGLSGKPLYGKSTTVLRRMRLKLHDSIPLIGVGGICSGADAAAKITAGAKMVQFYTGMIYRGPELIGESVDAIRRLKEQGRG